MFHTMFQKMSLRIIKHFLMTTVNHIDFYTISSYLFLCSSSSTMVKYEKKTISILGLTLRQKDEDLELKISLNLTDEQTNRE